MPYLTMPVRSNADGPTAPSARSVQCRGPHDGPHNRCSHATALPPGYHRCHGERGCPARLTPGDGDYCDYHRELYAGVPGAAIERYDLLMGEAP